MEIEAHACQITCPRSQSISGIAGTRTQFCPTAIYALKTTVLCFSTGTCNQCKPWNKHDTFLEHLFSLKIWKEKLHNLSDNIKYFEKSKQT